MTLDEAKAVVEYARTLWPQWDPDDADLGAWADLMGRINSADVARKGLRELKTTTDWKGPKRSQVLELLKQQTGPMHAETAHDGHPGMYVQCTQHSDKPGMIGHFLTLYWPTDKEMPPDAVVYTRMETFRAEQQTLYGGTWQLIRSFQDAVTDGDMIRRRAELRPAAKTTGPLVETIARAAEQAEKRAESAESAQPSGIRQAVGDFLANKPPATQPPPGVEIPFA